VGVARRISAFKPFYTGNLWSDGSEILPTDSKWPTFGGRGWTFSRYLHSFYQFTSGRNTKIPQESAKSRYNGAYGRPLNFYNSPTVSSSRTKFSGFVGIDMAYNLPNSDEIRFIIFRVFHHIPPISEKFDSFYLGNEQKTPIFSSIIDNTQ
jgi:hypothetical protein